jgi:outer membrane protein assembly factor BamB
MMFGVMGGLLFGFLFIVWWAFFSKAPAFDRWFAPVLMVTAIVTTSELLHKSMATAMMGLVFYIYAVPVLCLVFIIWALTCGRLSTRPRLESMTIAILLASGFWVFIRTDGMDGQSHQYFNWRWAKSSEERLLSGPGDKCKPLSWDSSSISKQAEWPGFPGLNRDGIVRGIKINTDWIKSPPHEIWRRAVGPACSSFAVQGGFLYTQEQRGEYETVSCYNLNNGEPVWRHGDSARFWDAHAGAGPRSTPTISNGRVYTLGATGILNVLDAYDGKVVWSRNAANDTKVKFPGWGSTGSPLVADSLVFIAISGELLAYHIASGKKLWAGPDGGESYSSPHLLTIDGIRQIVFLNGAGATSFSPADGKELWKLPFKGSQIVQPALASENDLFVSLGDMQGMQSIAVSSRSGKWSVTERWKSTGVNPYFNDFVVHKGHVYGFDGPSLACIDIEKGVRSWKGGHYGGQILLLTDQDLLLVLSEKGDLALVKADPTQFKEIARFPAIKGRTWNHPVLAGNVLVVRNSQEMAAFRLPLVLKR